MRALRGLLAVVLCLAPWGFVQAHGQSTALVRLSGNGSTLDRMQLDLALVDLEQALGLDADGDGTVTWGELRARAPAIEQYVRQRVVLRQGEKEGMPCRLQPAELLVDDHADGAYAVLTYPVECPSRGVIALDYGLFFDQNPMHRALVSWELDGMPRASEVLSASSSHLTWSRESTRFFSGFASWVGEGIWHIWTGLDHLLFLATLLLAAANFGQVVRIISAFTLSHSLTLIGGALGWIHFPSRWVEAAIALTVLVGAVNLVVPLARRRLWLLALGFGLIHGLGFASVLAGMQLDGAHLVRDLLGFNIGVEVGQLAIVALIVPVIHLLRDRQWYRHRFTPGAATAIGAVAAVWLYQRLG